MTKKDKLDINIAKNILAAQEQLRSKKVSKNTLITLAFIKGARWVCKTAMGR